MPRITGSTVAATEATPFTAEAQGTRRGSARRSRSRPVGKYMPSTKPSGNCRSRVVAMRSARLEPSSAARIHGSTITSSATSAAGRQEHA